MFYIFALRLIRLHPQIIDSLFAIKIFLEFLIAAIVSSKPARPGIAAIVISFLLILLN